MPKKRSTGKKKTRKKSNAKKLFKRSLVKAFVGVAILVLLVVFAGLVARFLISGQKPPSALAPSQPLPIPKQPIAEIPTFEIYPQKEIPPAKKAVRPALPKTGALPVVAIIIDDLGYDQKIAEKFSQLDTVLAFSILPHSPYQEKIATLSRDRGFDVMLHLPMEPIEYPTVNPGKGTLLTSMSPDELIRQLEENLDAVPFIKGVNNHMGSRMTAESSQMYQIFSILKKRGLFFIDSRTTAATLCRPSARLFQIPFAQRDTFLDHLQKPDFVRKQIEELIQVARRNGHAIGIGHPHLTTYNVLREMLPHLQKAVELVPASQIVQPVG